MNIDEILKSTGIIPLQETFEPEFLPFKDALKTELASFKIEKESFLFNELANLDTFRNRMYNGIVTILKGKLCHYDDNRLQSSQRLMLLFDKYGNPTMLPYNEETAVLLSLVADLESKLFDDIALLNLTKWVSNLKKANLSFDKLMSDHRFEYLEKEYPPLRIAKLATDSAHARIVDLLQAQILINGKSQYSQTIVLLQSFLVHFRKEYSIEFKEKNTKSHFNGASIVPSV